MKNILLVLSFLFIVTSNLFAQPWPPIRTTYAVEPSISPDKSDICQINVIWEAGDKSPAIQMITDFYYTTGAPEKIEIILYGTVGGPTHYYFPKKEGELGMTNYSTWAAFAQNIKQRFVVVSDNIYVEADQYKVVAHTKMLDESEYDWTQSCLVLENKFRIITVSESRWCGRIPAKGEKIYLGRDGTTKGGFFAARRCLDHYELSSTTMEDVRIKRTRGQVWHR